MTRGARVRRGVVALSVVVAGAGCTGGRPAAEQVSPAAPPDGRTVVAGVTGTSAARPARTGEVRNFPVGSWRRLPLSAPVRLEIPAIGVSSSLVCDNLVVSATRVADGPGAGR